MTTATKTISFTVYGKPQQRGSKTGFPIKRANGKMGVAMSDSNKKSKPWMAAVAAAGAEAMGGSPLILGPVVLMAMFFFKRPASHYGTGRNAGKVKKSAPVYHTQTPDLAKLIRCLEDSLTGIIFKDDRQAFRYRAVEKLWTDSQERAEVTIDPLETT